jgi:hypothetical protein
VGSDAANGRRPAGIAPGHPGVAARLGPPARTHPANITLDNFVFDKDFNQHVVKIQLTPVGR